LSFDTLMVLGLLAGALLFLLTGWLRADLVAVLVLVGLVLGGVLEPGQAFRGFASNAVMTIAGLLVLGRALVRTGVVKWVAELVERLAGSSRLRVLSACMLLPGLLSGFINIVAAAAFFIPMIYTLERHGRVPRALLLLPMAAASLAGANLTLVGASHNLVVNDILGQEAGAGLGVFELAPLGLLILAAVAAYTLLGGWRLIPGAGQEAETETPKRCLLLEAYDLEDRLWELWIKDASRAVSAPLREAGLGERYGLAVLSVVRGGRVLPVNHGDLELEPDDLLLVSGNRRAVDGLLAERENFALLGHPPDPESLATGRAELVEVLVPPRSALAGSTLRELDFRQRHGLTAVALWRDGGPLRTGARDEPLREGDGILLYGPRENTRGLEPGPELLWVHAALRPEAPPALRAWAPWAAAILAAVVGLAAAGVVPIQISALAGAALVVALGLLDMGEAYRAIDWQTLVLIGGMYPLGIAMQKTGAGPLLADWLGAAAGGLGPVALLLSLAVVTMALTQFLHNAAVAMIMAPVAVSLAQAADANPKTFALAVVAAASATFLLPYGHPAALLVREPGGYRRRDYLRYGLAPCLLTLAVVGLFIPFWWPL
jgi:di/tricarboxylate transporter